MNLGIRGCSEPRSRHFTPAWAMSETLSEEKKKIGSSESSIMQVKRQVTEWEKTTVEPTKDWRPNIQRTQRLNNKET